MFKLENKFYDKLSDILEPIEFVEKKKGLAYLNAPIAFDIEVSSFLENEEKRCTMYAFVFGINGKCVLGRTWDDFKEIITNFIKYYKIDNKHRAIIFVHNLSYEFQFIKDMFEWTSLLCLEQRKVITATTNIGLEFRCSYLLSGLSLARVGENLIKYKVQKMVGGLDYKLIRHSFTPLTDKERGYILNDGLVVMAYIEEEIERLGNITKLPYTKTGYARNKCREYCFNGPSRSSYNNLIRRLTLTDETYTLINQAYVGGFTHASIYKVNQMWENVASFDFTSSYPAVMLSEMFPMSEPKYKHFDDYDDFLDYIEEYCCVFLCKLKNVKQKFKYESYISQNKCIELVNPRLDNGRVRSCDECLLALTELDFKIICKVYTFSEVEISNFYYMEKDYLPKEIIEATLDLYENKTSLKGIKGKEQEYLVSKGMLNSLYGMCVTDIVREDICYENHEWINKPTSVYNAINKYNKSMSRFLFYPWGVWISAYARYNLWLGILEFGEDYIYSDTDSLKVLNYQKHYDFLNEYNRRVTEKIYDCLEFYNIDIYRAHPKNSKGEQKYLGIWDFEGVYSRFKTLGAKRYITEKDNEIEITISGVNKEKGKKYLQYAYKTNDEIFKRFENGLEFPATYGEEEESATGKQTLTYIDNEIKGNVTDYTGVTINYHELSGVYMEATSYVMDINIEYLKAFLYIVQQKREA